MIEVRSLQKTYRSHGAAVGLLGADFLVPDGQIVGILGENGAGKTTMLRCIAGLLPHKGTALLDGRPAGVQFERISYITGEGSYYPALTVAAYGQLLTDLHPAFDPARYEKFLEFFALHGTDTIGRLSTGQRARVELAAGWVGCPQPASSDAVISSASRQERNFFIFCILLALKKAPRR